MPPRITRVKWSALDVPFGVKFDEATGTFSGIPEDVENYIVPVKVTTNYGSDMKNVEFNVLATHNVYAIGIQAETWSGGAEGDEYGFRQLNMPKVYKLEQHPLGFGAKVADGGYYACGISGFYNSEQTDSTNNIAMNTVPQLLKPSSFTKDSNYDVKMF